MANQRFEEIDVERINIVESDGTPKLTISNKARFPDPLLEGTPDDRTGKRGAGLLFYNDDGFEVGGLTLDGSIGHGSTSLTFDRFGQDQVIQIGYGEHDGGYYTGLQIHDRPDETLDASTDAMKRIEAMPDGEEKQKAIAGFWEKHPPRIALARSINGEAAVYLMDSKGKPRIRICVDAQDEPRLQFLDAEGNVTFSLPPES